MLKLIFVLQIALQLAACGDDTDYTILQDKAPMIDPIPNPVLDAALDR